MNEKQQERAMILLKAAHEILKKCDESMIIEDVMCMTAMWDEVECDGDCLMNEIGELIEEVE